MPTKKVNGEPEYTSTEGATSFTVKVSAKEDVPPPAFDPVTEYIVDGVTVVGVPPIAPVEASNVNPAGKAGETANNVAPPTGVTDKTTVDSAVPAVNVNADLM